MNGDITVDIGPADIALQVVQTIKGDDSNPALGPKTGFGAKISGNLAELTLSAGADVVLTGAGITVVTGGYTVAIAKSDVAPPELVDVVAGGAALRLRYSEALDEDSVPLPARFTVTVNGSAVTVNTVEVETPVTNRNYRPSYVWLGLASAVAVTDTVTVSYDAANAASPLQDLLGEPAPAIPASQRVNLRADTPPRFTSGSSFSVAENQTAVGTVTAQDTDDAITGYAVTGGADQAQFAITPAGVLTFATAPSYENPGHVAGNNE